MHETITVSIHEEPDVWIYALEMIDVPRVGEYISFDKVMYQVEWVVWVINTDRDDSFREVELTVVKVQEQGR